MELKKTKSNGLIEITTIHICVLCTKPVIVNKEKFLHVRKNGKNFYSHEQCVISSLKRVG